MADTSTFGGEFRDGQQGGSAGPANTTPSGEVVAKTSIFLAPVAANLLAVFKVYVRASNIGHEVQGEELREAYQSYGEIRDVWCAFSVKRKIV